MDWPDELVYLILVNAGERAEYLCCRRLSAYATRQRETRLANIVAEYRLNPSRTLLAALRTADFDVLYEYWPNNDARSPPPSESFLGIYAVDIAKHIASHMTDLRCLRLLARRGLTSAKLKLAILTSTGPISPYVTEEVWRLGMDGMDFIALVLKYLLFHDSDSSSNRCVPDLSRVGYILTVLWPLHAAADLDRNRHKRSLIIRTELLTEAFWFLQPSQTICLMRMIHDDLSQIKLDENQILALCALLHRDDRETDPALAALEQLVPSQGIFSSYNIRDVEFWAGKTTQRGPNGYFPPGVTYDLQELWFTRWFKVDLEVMKQQIYFETEFHHVGTLIDLGCATYYPWIRPNRVFEVQHFWQNVEYVRYWKGRLTAEEMHSARIHFLHFLSVLDMPVEDIVDWSNYLSVPLLDFIHLRRTDANILRYRDIYAHLTALAQPSAIVSH